MATLYKIPTSILLSSLLFSTFEAQADSAPERLEETGLYADFATKQVSADIFTYTPVYPLWTDGATKRRWLFLPPGSTIDASLSERWIFPVGTKLWKEFSFKRRIETRYMELGAGGWIYATYVWNETETAALRASARGLANIPTGIGDGRHTVPGRYDCLSCHQGGAQEVLGLSPLQLSPLRDPLAPHGESARPGDLDLRALVERGLITGIPASLLKKAPRIPGPPQVRAARGYLHGNCGHCHNSYGPLADLDMNLAYSVEEGASHAWLFQLESAPRTRARAVHATQRLVPGDAAASALIQRMSSSDPNATMPPLGRTIIDSTAIELLTRFVRDELAVKTASHNTTTPERLQ